MLNQEKVFEELVKHGVTFFTGVPDSIVDAFEKAWQTSKADSPEYFTLYKGKGSVGGEKK